jgi:hypothetical protein
MTVVLACATRPLLLLLSMLLITPLLLTLLVLLLMPLVMLVPVPSKTLLAGPG